ncbi:MAG TPA: DUF4058 family protein [Gemmataceae bacterium]|jgi:hypothetical protein|nr:DUF4058 family protein [Gemmataceae bacterium]
MPLRDHFRSPVNDKDTWGSVYGMWPATIVRELFDLLPPGFQAEPNINLGSPFEIDIGTFDDEARDAMNPISDGGTATMVAIAPTHTVEADLSEQDIYEVRIYDVDRGRRLVAAIEIVSPSNKDRPETREVFVAKVAALLQKGVCVAIVDLVTIRQFNLYADLLTLLGRSDPHLAPTPPNIYAVALRSRNLRKMPSLLDAWFYPMTVGQPLPTLPIWLSPDRRVLLNLETSYEESCRLLRIL